MHLATNTPDPSEHHDGDVLFEHHLSGPGFEAAARTWNLIDRCEFCARPAEHVLVLNVGARSRYALAKVDGFAPLSGVIRPGQVSVFPAGRCLSGHTVGAGTESVLVLRLSPDLVSKATLGEIETVDFQPSPTLDLHVPAIAQGLAALHMEAPQPGVMSRMYTESIVLNVLVELVRRAAPYGAASLLGGASLPRPRLERVIEYVETFLADDLSIQTMAKVAEMSPATFGRSFKRQMGLSPHQYVLRRRVERAVALLSCGDLPIVDVALSVGFSSQSHLTNALRRAHGATPRKYRVAIRPQ